MCTRPSPLPEFEFIAQVRPLNPKSERALSFDDRLDEMLGGAEMNRFALQLERKLNELLGEQVWAESGLGAHHDIEQLQRRITTLEQRIVELTAELDERTQELDAARASNRELMTHLNTLSTR